MAQMNTDAKRYVDSYTSNGGTSAKLRRARDWTRRASMPCPFCSSRPTRGDWVRHITAKHAPDGAARDPWIKAFTFGEVEYARNCTNGSVRTDKRAA